MDSNLERQRSLKKLHFCIANHHATQDDRILLRKAQEQLKEKIEMKFKRSNINQNYVFPKKLAEKEQYGHQSEICNLRQQNQSQQNKENAHQQRQKPKIKLGRIKNDKRVQTQHLQVQNVEKQSVLRREAIPKIPLKQISSHYIPFYPQVGHQRMKTSEYVSKSNYQSNTIKIVECEQGSFNLQTNGLSTSLQKGGSRSTSKSKLSMLTKSYMNLKSSKLPQQLSLSKQISNSIRISDYKFMPNTATNNTNSYRYTRPLYQCSSNRDLVPPINQYSSSKYSHIPIDKKYIENYSLQKRSFRAK